jgi:hypothetical protein
MLSLKAGLPAALLVFGCVPDGLRTDQSSTATHQFKRGETARGFNQGYLALCEHYELKPATINRACPQENGDIESANGHLKRRPKTHLALRGSRGFASEAAYAAFVAEVCRGNSRAPITRPSCHAPFSLAAGLGTHTKTGRTSFWDRVQRQLRTSISAMARMLWRRTPDGSGSCPSACLGNQ